MKLREMKVNTFSLIEEYYPELNGMAEDTDVLNKINGVINNVSMDLMKYKKIPASKSVSIKLEDSKIINLVELIGEEYFQINNIDGVSKYDMLDDITLKLPEEFVGDITIYYYKYPKMVKTIFEAEDEEEIQKLKEQEDNEFIFDLATDVLHVMPYGVAADLLKMDMISGYGKYFYERYLELKNNINPKRTSGLIYSEGGADI